jgi:tRNA modification GTPase
LDGDVVDDVMAVFFAAPNSYTGEDSMEIHCHGNMLIAEKILLDLCAKGCRFAEPGEFTRRAFLNGKMDLCQAEAVADVIHAASERAIRVAQNQLSGALGEKIGTMSKNLLKILAKIEGGIDFPEYEVATSDTLQSEILPMLEDISEKIKDLIDSHRFRASIEGGITAVIFGEPNVGKSSLFNCLLGEDRAIVSEVAGTTRDMISEKVVIGGNVLKIYDTAGLRVGNLCEVERIGIEKAITKLMAAELFLVVVDASSDKIPQIPSKITNLLHRENTLLVINKIDLGKRNEFTNFLPNVDRVEISGIDHSNSNSLKGKISEMISRNEIFSQRIDISVNGRHVKILHRASENLSTAMKSLQNGDGTEIAASDIRQALEVLGEITGAFDAEKMLDLVFSNFCVGK